MEHLKKQESTRDYDRLIKTTCRHCPTGCGMKVYLKGDGIVDILGDEDHPLSKGSLCPKGLASYQYIYHPSRLKYPVIRKRLGDEFSQTSWGEALDFAAKRLAKIRDKYGPEALCLYSTDTSDFGNITCAQRFGKLFATPNVFDSTSPSENPGVLAYYYTFGVKGSCILMNPQYDWPNSRCIMIVDSDPATSDPILMGWIINAQERGTKLIVIDSRDTVTMSKADIPLKVSPGAEVALLLGMVNFIVEENLYDTSFVRKWVKGLEEWMEVVREYSLEKVVEISEIPGTTLVEAARLFATLFPSQIIAGTSSANRYYPLNLIRACAGLVALTGSIGVTGGGLNLLDNAILNASADIEGSRETDTDKPLPLDSLFSMVTREHRPIKALIWTGNAAAQSPFQQKFKQGLENLELIIHLSCFPDMTCNLSHISLPMASWIESEGLVYRTNSRSLQWHNQIVAPVGECRTFADFWSGLSDRFGWQKWFPWRNENGQINIRQMTDFFLGQEELTAGITSDLLDPEKNPLGGIMWPCLDIKEADYEERAPVRGKGILFKAGELFPGGDRRFPTPSGKIELASDRLRRQGLDYLPVYHAPIESLADTPDLALRFPLMLSTGTLVDYIPEVGYWLSWGDNSGQAYLFVQIHPRIAKLLELGNTDTVIVENDRGSVEGPCWLSKAVSPRSVWCPEATDEFQPLFPYHSANGLMNHIPDVYQRGQVNSNLTLVRIYKKGTRPQDAVDKLNSFFKGL
ncbi:Formate dehydrogenase H [subsurface metagenome]